jgi:hypothetical protein
VSRACGTHGRGERRVQCFGGKRPLGGPRLRWEDGIKIDLEEPGWGGVVEWIHRA